MQRNCQGCLDATGGESSEASPLRDLRVCRRWLFVSTTINLAVSLVLISMLATMGWTKTAEPEPRQLPSALRNSVGMHFVLIEPETFAMGSPEGEPERGGDEERHLVSLSKSFYMGKFEVTQEQYASVLGGDEPPGRLPVTGVSWHDAQRFCDALNEAAGEQEQGRRYRLPTEAEWEYCCRASTKTAYSIGEKLTLDRARFQSRRLRGDGLREPVDGPAPVGTFPPNALGLYDMHGNAWEWCSDWYGPYNEQPPVDPAGAEEGTRRVVRGGGWRSAISECRAARRLALPPDWRSDEFGFRVVCELVSP